MLRKAFIEGTSTFVLCLGVGMSRDCTYCPSLVLFAALAFTAFASGSHLNPAVSVGVILKLYLTKALEKEKLVEFLIYIPVECLFGFLGALCSYSILGETKEFRIHHEYSLLQGFAAEFAFSWVLVGTVMTVAEYGESRLLGGGTVCAAVLVGDYSVGKISSAVFNPALGLGFNLMHAIKKGNYLPASDTWVYFVAPISAGVVSALFFAFLKSEIKVKVYSEK